MTGLLKGAGWLALLAFQLFSLAQLWSAWSTGAIYVRSVGMMRVDANHAAYTQHMALYIIGAASVIVMVAALLRRR